MFENRSTFAEVTGNNLVSYFLTYEVLLLLLLVVVVVYFRIHALSTEPVVTPERVFQFICI